MSLINKMLRDLDARHASTGPNVLPDEVRPLPEEVAAPRVSRRVSVSYTHLTLPTIYSV